MSLKGCRYSIDGFIFCSTKTAPPPPASPNLEGFKASEYSQVCPPGSYSQKCKITSCRNNIMNGICMRLDNTVQTIQNFDAKPCTALDMYFDTSFNRLSCASSK